MDYSIIKTIHQSASRDGLDLSINHFPNTEFDRTFMKCSNNNFNINQSSCSRLSPSAQSDVDEPMDYDGRKSTIGITMPQRICHHLTNTIALHQDSTKLKLKFSVDRILGRDTDTSSRTSSHDSGFIRHIVHDNCVDCSEPARRETSEMVNNNSALYSTPFSVASMLGFGGSAVASVVRPLAMRYLQRSPPLAGKY